MEGHTFSLLHHQTDIIYSLLPLHTYVNMFGLHWEECALRLPYKISRPFPCWLPFMPPRLQSGRRHCINNSARNLVAVGPHVMGQL